MQYKFLTIYHNFDDKNKNLIEAQRSLLFKWWQRTSENLCKREKLDLVPYIPRATIEFRDYSFFDYYDQEKAKNHIKEHYGHKLKMKAGGGYEYYWGGTKYPDLNTIYKALAEQKRFMELIITTEDTPSAD